MRIAERFTGPPGSGNGGYSAGLFAGDAPTAEVTLRLPPPLGVELTVADGLVTDPLGQTIAQVRAVEPVTEVVEAVPASVAAEVSRGYPGFTAHPFPGCWVCGPEHPDGLRIFPGPLAPGRTAAPWTPGSDVDRPTVWAALDCPGGWSVIGAGAVYVLGRITVTVHALPDPGSSCVVVGAAHGVEGRKAQVSSTLYAPGGQPLATSRATWVRVG
jgi:hypothetical protein